MVAKQGSANGTRSLHANSIQDSHGYQSGWVFPIFGDPSMKVWITNTFRLLALTSLVGCALKNATEGRSAAPGGAGETPRKLGNATVITGQQLGGRGGGGLLEALAGRVTNMRIERRSGGCPFITLRGQRTLMGPSNPKFYVDGTPVESTCTLDQIRIYEVKQVEVYASGLTRRPGYSSSPFGLVLVFLVDGQATPN